MKEKFDIRVGDRYEFRSNDGIIPRTVTAIGSRRIAYINARGKKCDCYIQSFKSWLTGAELVYRIPDLGDK